MTAAEARKKADDAAEFVRDLRRLLGKAMAEEATARKVAREAEEEDRKKGKL